jgi:Trk K+ transport system NAD-binding subunit
MSRQRRRLLAYLGLLTGVSILYTLLFKHGMAALEQRPLSYVESFHFVIETFTTTGYGEYAPWESAPMLLLVDAMQLTGVFLIFLSLPLFVVPWIEQRLEVQPPSSVTADDHVVICGFGPRGETLANELAAQDVDHVVLESDWDTAQSLHEAGQPVVHGDPGSTTALERVSVPDARAVVLNESDERNATIALSVRELDAAVQTVGFVEDPSQADYIRYAGADRVLSPHEILGDSLADKVRSGITNKLGDTVRIGEDFEIVEMPIQRDSELDGVTLGASGIRERTGVNVIGAWFSGEFLGAPDPERELDFHTILLVAGRRSNLEDLKEITLAEERSRRTERVVLAGYGEVGSTIRSVLDREDITTTVVDLEEQPGVDVVGDVTEGGTLAEADIADASTLILALGDDTTTVFATLVAREANESLEIICRANEAESARKLYAAGADYVLALSTVAGRMLAQTILGEDVMALDKQIDIVRTDAPAFEGQTLAEADVRSRTGCTVIAVEREGEVLSDLDPEFRIREGDSLVVAGTDEDIAQFNDVADVNA